MPGQTTYTAYPEIVKAKDDLYRAIQSLDTSLCAEVVAEIVAKAVMEISPLAAGFLRDQLNGDTR